MDGLEWKSALRLQVEALARRNQLHGKCRRDSVRRRTMEMDTKIVRLRELVSSNANEAARFYLECVCHADETERILNRTSSHDKKRKKKPWLESRRSVADSSTSPRTIPPSTAGDCGVTIQDVVSIHDTIAQSSLHDTVPQRWWRTWNITKRDDDDYAEASERRELWKTQKDFFFTCLGFMVGTGNIIRFPAKVYQYGGGVFFIPYLLCLLFIGFPLVFLHLSIGQYSALSASHAFKKMMPIASCLGWALVLIAIPMLVYYNMIVAWSAYYFWHSIKGFFIEGLPWDQCQPEWADDHCCDLQLLHTCFNSSVSISAPEAFFYFEVHSLSDKFDFSLGPLQPHLVACLAFAWFLVFIGVFKGIGWIGSSMNFTATVPYLLLMILLLRGISLPGANKGLNMFFSANLHALWSIEIWKSAAEQVFYELGISAGPLISMAAFSRYRNNVYRDAALLVVLDALTSTLAGMVIFSFVGFLAHSSGSRMTDILKNDPMYLCFTVYPGVTSFMEFGSLWASLFFVMLILAAIDAEFAWLEMIASAVMGHMATNNKTVENRILAALCIGGFFCGLPFCAKGGLFFFHAMDNLNARWNSFFLVLPVLLVVCYYYGTNRFLHDISGMLRVGEYGDGWHRLKISHRIRAIFGPNGFFIKSCWNLIIPISITVLLLTSSVSYRRLHFSGHELPIEYELITWIIMIIPLLILPIMATTRCYIARRDGKTLSSLFDTSGWSKVEEDSLESDDIVTDIPPNRRGGGPMRENTYMYIDAASRGPTVRSHHDNYGWRTGRLHELQIQSNQSDDSVSHPSFSSSFASPSPPPPGDIALFGSPPLTNVFMLSNAITIKRNSEKKKATPRQETSFTIEPSRDEVTTKTYPHAKSEPPMKSTSHLSTDDSLPLCISPSHSEPARHIPSSPLPSFPPPIIPSTQHSDNSEYDDDEYSETGGIRPMRRTVIKRFRSEDSFAPSSVSMSITPLDLVRQRSLSSVAIFDQKGPQHPIRPTLSQLKRPAPIHDPTKF